MIEIESYRLAPKGFFTQRDRKSGFGQDNLVGTGMNLVHNDQSGVVYLRSV